MRVCVIGGGISGLTAAYRLKKGGAVVDLLEGSARVGGLLGSEQIEDHVVETGADSILTDKPWALRLAEELGLTHQIIGTNPKKRGAHIVHRGRLERIPAGFSLIAPTDLLALARSPVVSARGTMRAALDLVVPRRDAARSDESLEHFVVRRLGRELFERLAQPLAGGIYGADPKKLSLAATMPRFLELEREYGSVIRGLRARARQLPVDKNGAAGARYGLFAAFSGGMQTFVSALEKELEGQIETRSLVTSLGRTAEGYRIEVQGAVRSYDAVVLALPSYVAAQVVRGFDASLSRALSEIDYASAATITLSWPRAAIPHPLDAFGYVVPAIEQRSVIASTWASVKYERRAPVDKALLRVFVGGHRGQHLVQYDERELIGIAKRELGELIGVSAAPEWTRVQRYVRAMPQYHVGHLDRVARIEALERQHEGFALAGNAYRGVGIPDAVKSGEDAAARLLGEDAQPYARSSTLSASS
ncbi:MAG: Protoporphyrinogen oxidase, aerobic, HemY [Myxococcaceae bacterium]|nr:Protoporphyrinogen oxidase, aerobic, HemY [Myxococcaceae bacterium]